MFVVLIKVAIWTVGMTIQNNSDNTMICSRKNEKGKKQKVADRSIAQI